MQSKGELEEYSNTYNETASVNHTIYYGVYIPHEFQFIDPDSNPNVFEDKESVFQLLKQHKKARFKAFNLYHEAADFAINGSENPNNNSTIDSIIPQKVTVDVPQLVGEKPSPFKGPKPQDMVILRKAIEKGDEGLVDKIVWKNPRYLISSGDTPSIFHEGCRYNALHVAAKSKNCRMVDQILSTVSNIEFVKLLYGDDNTENAKERANVFLDLYLNTPDKSLNETPLHFAVKYGAVEVVEILVSYPQCDKTIKNKFGLMPRLMICDRCEKSDKNLCKRIEQLLDETYYVPVWRAEDNSLPPKIGEPFSPTNPPVFNTHPSSPRLEIQAYAGPMNKEGAEHFRKVWKTPPRTLKSKKLDYIENVASLKYKDPLKGLELVGKTLASQYDISWKEYWPFLDSFVDITSDEGLNLLENHLKSRILDVSNNVNLVSSISDLCNKLEAFCIDSSNGSIDNSSFQDELDSSVLKNFSPFLCLEKACEVFANRFANYILNTVNGNLVNILDTEIKQLEIVILSYMDDERFKNINFKCVHFRLANLIAQRLYINFEGDKGGIEMLKKIESLIEICTKSLDCFSSDDESVNSKDILTIKKGTSIKKQLLCLAHSILNQSNQGLEPYLDNKTEEDCLKIWNNMAPCTCVLYARKSRKTSSFQRNSLRRFNSSNFFQDSARRLFADDLNESNCSERENILEESFFTPDSSQNISDDEDKEEVFDDATSLNNYDIYVEGKSPSKADCAVFNALKYSGCDIDQQLYPHIYLWKHNVGQFSEEERNSWRKRKNDEDALDSPCYSTSTPQKVSPPLTSTPTKSWLRITGVNSPKSVKRSSVLSGIY